ncbi:MAG: 4Fe-4S dicluster domain-containing protein [Eubacteriales bacterium]|nr:4Fe-4S dicluster domain-containing protein [Eubacteriales bacterium]MDD3866645.1 4Fe-4S dicluster domain-containing protein [Eubacteriales bacterium]
MRGIFTPITKIRRQVFTEIARFAYERPLVSRDFSVLDEAPYRIIPGEVPQYRESVFKERAIVRERLRLAMGLPMRPASEHQPFTRDMETACSANYQIREPLVQVIPFACESCPTDRFQVTDNCRRCLAHPCSIVCPVKAITIEKSGAVINQDLCIKCGRCVEACPYHAIIRFGRPCAEACGANAIDSDELGRAVINQDNCVACGLCMVSCPFAAISDKSEILQIVSAIREGRPVYAEIAPSFVGQFGPLAKPGQILAGILALGFRDVVEVGLGADLGSLHEADIFLERVPEKQRFLGTSCCPSWEDFARKTAPDLDDCIASAHTPMVATAIHIKQQDPQARVVFIGPCVAKKREALEPDVQPYVDYVLTFEELMGMFSAHSIELTDMDELPFTDSASRDGRGYAVAGGVADAIRHTIERRHPGHAVPVMKADSLQDCRKMLLLARAGKADGHLLEGMACPGGCIGGPGTLSQINRSGKAVQAFSEKSPYRDATENPRIAAPSDEAPH